MVLLFVKKKNVSTATTITVRAAETGAARRIYLPRRNSLLYNNTAFTVFGLFRVFVSS